MNAPTNASQLVRGPFRSALGRYRPINKMRKHLGKQFTVEELYDSDRHSEEDIPKLRLVRAYQVTPLIGATILVKSEKDIAGSLSKLLATRLPEIAWQVEPDWSGPFLKYLCIHGSIPAPPDKLTLEPMALELYGELIAIRGRRLDTEEGKEWTSKLLDECLMAYSRDEAAAELTGEMIISIKSATYANVMFPGVGVPIYS